MTYLLGTFSRLSRAVADSIRTLIALNFHTWWKNTKLLGLIMIFPNKYKLKTLLSCVVSTRVLPKIRCYLTLDR